MRIPSSVRIGLLAAAVLLVASVAAPEATRASRKADAKPPAGAAGTAKKTQTSAAVRPASQVRPATRIAPATTETTGPAQARLAHIRMAGSIMDSPPDFSLFGDSGYMTVRDWLQRIAAARNDNQVAAVAIDIDSPRMSWAHAQEIADAIRRADEVKPVHTYITSGGATEYLVASAGRKVSMEPTGSLTITGLGAELMFFRGTLDWLNVKVQMVQVGKFKGAQDSLTRADPSPEMLGELNKVMDDLYEQLCEQIAQQRKLTVPHVKFVIDEGPLSATDAQRHRFVDRLVTKLDWRQYVEEHVAPKGAAVAWLEDYAAKPRQSLDLSNPFTLFRLLVAGPGGEEVREPTIAIIHADGMIVPGSGGESFFGSRLVGARTLVECFEQARKDDRIKAVIFRIDSPGGSALASELIYQAARKCAGKKPVIASISQTGGSGGYYIAVGADTILADPSALVGSIGVLSGKLAITECLDKKLGIKTYEITRGKNAGLWMSREWTPREVEIIRKQATETYDVFVKRVTDSRAGKAKSIAQVTEGRIFTARQAAANGLIDRVGGMREAVAAAQEAAGLKSSYFISLPRPRSLMDFLGGGGDDAAMPGAVSTERMVFKRLAERSPGMAYLMSLAELLDKEVVLTAMPYYPAIRP